MFLILLCLFSFSAKTDQVKLLANDNLAIEMRMNIITNAKKEIFI